MASSDLDIVPLPLTEEEKQQRFAALQQSLQPLWKSIQSLSDDKQTIVVVPSLTVDYAIQGSEVQAYEERFLFLLLLLRQPNARLVYITSQRIQPILVDYYLGLLPGVIASHARQRLFLVAPEDSGPEPLTIKLLKRPGLLQKIRALVPDRRRAHLVPFNTTHYERDLALSLGIPMYGADPQHLRFGTKSGCRNLFREAGIAYPVGVEDLNTVDDVVRALTELRSEHQDVEQVMLKHNDGVSGEGNAVIDLSQLPTRPSKEQIETRVRGLQLEAPYLGVEGYFEKLERGGGIVEQRIVSDVLLSPSVQLRITPLGQVELLSTHDQLLGGPSGQSFLGCTFPANPEYAPLISREANKVAELLSPRGVLGRFAIDFIVARTPSGWRPYAIELNLRKGGTTHPFLTLQFLTDGQYDAAKAEFRTPHGERKHFVASDHVESAKYRAFTPEDVFDIAVRHGLHFDQTRETGVVFHMLTALGDKGRLGLTAVENDAAAALKLYQRSAEILNREADAALVPRPLP